VPETTRLVETLSQFGKESVWTLSQLLLQVEQKTLDEAKKMVRLRHIKCKLLDIIPRNLHCHNNKIKQISYCHNHKAIVALGMRILVSALWDLRVDVVGIGGGSLFVLMIETPHTLHTHSRSSLYIYNAIQHLQQWLPVIRMQPHPDICPLGPESGCCWYRRWVSVCSYD